MKLFKLVKDEDINVNNVKHVKEYESENYILRIINYDNGRYSADLNKISKDNYIPNLYVDYEIYNEYKVNDIRIQTSGFGSVEVEEIQKMIMGYNIAIESVKELKNILKENNLLGK